MADDSDLALLQAWAEGDRKAGDALLRQHFDALWRFFRNKVDEGAEDLIQRTFMACVRARDSFRGDASFRTWLFVIARNELYRHFRKGRAGLQADDLGSRSVVDLGAGARSLLAARQEHTLLLRALRQIPVDLQIALELFYWEGLSTNEIAKVLDVPQGTAKSRLRRAREALDAKMRELADDPQTLASTLASFDRWAAEVRNIVGPRGQ